MKQNRVLAWALGALLLLPGCGGGVEYETVYPELGAVTQVVEERGAVGYRDNCAVFSEVPGRIVTCAIQEGQQVTEGQVLYELDRSQLEDQIVQAQLALASAQATHQQALEGAADLQVRSYAAGVVTELLVHRGDFVSAGTPVAQVVDSQNLKLTVPFSSDSVAGMGPGTPAVITFSANSDRLEGRVERVYPNATVLAGGRSGVFVELSFSNPGAVASGAVAQATVEGIACMESGQVEYATQQPVYAAQSGQVIALHRQEGEQLEEGEVLLTLSNDAVTNGVTNAALGVSSAQVSLSQLEGKRADYTILAPVDGVVLQRSAKEGDYAAVATPLAVLAQPDSLYVQVDIDELYIGQVHPGQPVELTVTADGGAVQTYTGTVERIHDGGEPVGGVTTYPVDIALEDTQGLKDGMNVQVSITTSSVEDCLRLPLSALQGNRVQVLRGGTPQTVTVEVGVSGGGYVEIKSGLTQQDPVLVKP